MVLGKFSCRPPQRKVSANREWDSSLIKVTTVTTVALAILCLARTAWSDVEVGRALVDAFVNDVTTLSSRFEQVLIDADGVTLEVSSGTLDIHRPGQFRWAYDEPYEQWLVADGVNIWSYDVDLAQVTVKAQAQALANTPALLLAGSSDAMDAFEYDGSFIADGRTWVRMHPVDTGSGFKRVELAFEDQTLSQMVFFDNLDQTTRVSLSEVALNEAIDAEQFIFLVPDDVDVVGTPAVAATHSN